VLRAIHLVSDLLDRGGCVDADNPPRAVLASEAGDHAGVG
jgi:hypothetical protein